MVDEEERSDVLYVDLWALCPWNVIVKPSQLPSP